MIIVTHEMDFAGCGRPCYFMDDGVIIEQGSPQEVFGAPKEEN